MDFKLPPLGEGADSGTVVSVLVKEGDQVRKGQGLIEIETGKAVAPVPSPAAGKITKIHVKEGAKITVGQTLISLDSAEAAPQPAQAPVPAAPAKARPAKPAPARATATPPPAEEPVEASEEFEYQGSFAPPAAPSIRRIARELGLDLRKIQGSANGGRIVTADLKAHIQRLQRMAAPAAAPSAPEPPNFAQWGQIAKRPMTGLRKVISQRMAENWVAVPRVTQFDEADLSRVMELRKRHNPAFEKKGAKLTITPFAIKAVVAALKKHPAFNSSVDTAASEIIYKEYYNIGVAVDTDQGLIVPVIKNADKKSVAEISREVNDLAAKTRDRKVSLDDLRGGTFTISNQGGIGGAHFTPIVNLPEVAILGLGRGALKPVVRGAAIEPRLMLPLCLSYDHRVIDGGEAVRFILDVIQELENFSEKELSA
jgi:pyruvate dehydrogenase E2 component (dihydrolipoamide acetyltransferase)